MLSWVVVWWRCGVSDGTACRASVVANAMPEDRSYLWLQPDVPYGMAVTIAACHHNAEASGIDLNKVKPPSPAGASRWQVLTSAVQQRVDPDRRRGR